MYEYVYDQLNPDYFKKCISLTLPEGKILYEPELTPLVEKMIASSPAREILNRVLHDGPLSILSADKRGAPWFLGTANASDTP